MSPFRRWALLVLICGIASIPAPAPAAPPTGDGLVWFLRGPDNAIDAQHADRPVNPASVVKLATTLWALEQLGPEHRFETRVAIRGDFDPEAGRLDGDLIVLGGADIDFQVENAQWIARELNALGLRHVRGKLLVGPRFWIGWEGGSEGRLADRSARASLMARRLAKAWNPRRWDERRIRGMHAFHRRQGWEERGFARIEVEPGGLYDGPEPAQILMLHRSNPLKLTLQRFNVYSNNDIERLRHRLGEADAMTRWFRQRWQVETDAPSPTFATLSGLGRNRMTPRHVVALLDDLRAVADQAGLQPADLLPTVGCGRSTLRNYERLERDLPTASLAAKTGTLVQTDGGVVALAGWLAGAQGEVPFFVAATGTGAGMARGRERQAGWLLAQAQVHGPPRDRACPRRDIYSDSAAEVEPVSSVPRPPHVEVEE